MTWAASAKDFHKNAEIIAAKLDLYIVEIEGEELVATRVETSELTEEVE